MNLIKKYFISSRPWSYSASLISVLLGSVLARKEQKLFDFKVFILTLSTILSTHAAGNLVNSLYDYKNNVDTEHSDDKTLVTKQLEPKQLQNAIHFCYCFALTSFLVIVGFPAVSITHCLPLFVVGVLLSFLYTGFIGLKYVAMGDVVIFVVFGPIITLFAYAVQTGGFSLQCLICGLPMAALTEAILHSNNIRDLENDQKAGIVTIAILLGQSKASLLYSFLLLAPYIIVVFLSLLESYWLLLPVLSLPFAVKLKEECNHGNMKYHKGNNTSNHGKNSLNGRDEVNHRKDQSYLRNQTKRDENGYYHGNHENHHGYLENLPQKTAMLNLLFGVLYVIGLCIG